MALTLDVDLKIPMTIRDLAAGTVDALMVLLNLSIAPVLQVAGPDGSELDPDFLILGEACPLRLRIGQIAEVEVAVLRDRCHQDHAIACVTYAPLKTIESKALWLAAAMAIAKQNQTTILDEALLLKMERVVEPALVETALRLQGVADLFDVQAVRLWAR